MRRFFLVALLTASTLLAGITPPVSANYADKPLNTKKRLYVRKSGTRVYNDPASKQRRQWRYRRSDGRVVTKYTGGKHQKKKGKSKTSRKR